MIVPVVVALCLALYVLVIRPWMLPWGSTRQERHSSLPGDDLAPDARYVTTRAVTVTEIPFAVSYTSRSTPTWRPVSFVV